MVASWGDSRISWTWGIGNPSSGVLLLRARKSMQNWIEPSFFPTSSIGDAQGDTECCIIPCSSIFLTSVSTISFLWTGTGYAFFLMGFRLWCRYGEFLSWNSLGQQCKLWASLLAVPVACSRAVDHHYWLAWLLSPLCDLRFEEVDLLHTWWSDWWKRLGTEGNNLSPCLEWCRCTGQSWSEPQRLVKSPGLTPMGR